MRQETMSDDSSHYEISLTAGQAFTAFVLLLLSLASSFAFGFVVGKGRSGQAALVSNEPVIIDEGFSAEGVPEIEPPEQRVETPVSSPVAIAEPEPETRAAPAAPPTITEEPAPILVEASTEPVPHVAQLLSTQEARAAEGLAARLIDDGFTSAYVERVRTESGMIYRVRVTYPTEAAARSAVPSLLPYSPGEIWVSKK